MCFHARGLEDFGGEVAAEGSPERAIDGGVDVVLVAGDDFGGRESERTVGENGTVLDKGLVSE